MYFSFLFLFCCCSCFRTSAISVIVCAIYYTSSCCMTHLLSSLGGLYLLDSESSLASVLDQISKTQLFCQAIFILFKCFRQIRKSLPSLRGAILFLCNTNELRIVQNEPSFRMKLLRGALDLRCSNRISQFNMASSFLSKMGERTFLGALLCQQCFSLQMLSLFFIN